MGEKENSEIRKQFFAIKRVFLNQEGSEASRRHLKGRDKYFSFINRSCFRWERKPIQDKGVIVWSLWVTNKRTGKKSHGVQVSIPLGKICTEGWGFVANEIIRARRELRNGR